MKLIDSLVIDNMFLRDAPWMQGHGASPGYWGAGILYYALVYMLRAQAAVCLGSGGGFVPRAMRQAQRDLNLPDARTILIDAANSRWGKAAWTDPQHFFRTFFPDVEIIIKTTREAISDVPSPIDYLHIDANHDYDHVQWDYVNYSQLVRPGGVITLHDTNGIAGVKRFVDELSKIEKMLNFTDIGVGIAMVRI